MDRGLGARHERPQLPTVICAAGAGWRSHSQNPKSQGQKLTHEIADAADGRCNQTNRNGSIEAQN